MSSEGKKKRGESGVSNAKHIPFRYHGGTINRPAYNPSKIALNVPGMDHGGSTMARGFVGGLLAARLGYGFDMTERGAMKMQNALDQAPGADAVASTLE